MNGTAEKYLKWYTPVKGLLILIFAMGVYMGGLEIRVSHAEKDAAKVGKVQQDVAEIKGQVKILVDTLVNKRSSGTSSDHN